MKRWVKYPFCLMILVSSLVYGGGKLIGTEQEPGTQVSTVRHEPKEQAAAERKKETKKVVGKEEQSKLEEEQEKEKPLKSEEGKEEEKLSKPEEEQEEEKLSKPEEEQETEKPSELEKGQKDKTEKRKFERVEMDYLENALFIGDSRTSTLYEYAGWEKTDFFCKYGLTVWDVWESDMEGKTLESMLTGKQYGKIYIGLGINELGRGTSDSYAQQFKSVMEQVKAMQPEAVIFVESIMHVTQGKDDENTYINNQEINARNDKLKELADNKNIFYIDVNEVMDEPGTGKLKAEYSFDGVHLQVKYIDVWREFLLDHGIK